MTATTHAMASARRPTPQAQISTCRVGSSGGPSMSLAAAADYALPMLTEPPWEQPRHDGAGRLREGALIEADRQLPVGEEIFLDHVGHFVRDQEAASRALVRAG